MDRASKGKVGASWLRKLKSVHDCYTVNCKKKTRLNHLLQENGILSSIATDGCVYQLTGDRFKETFYSLKKVGLNKAFTFNGFCEYCDNNIFKDIEARDNKVPISEVDFCLFSIRPILHEIRKKQNNKRWWLDNPDPQYTNYRIFRSLVDDVIIEFLDGILNQCYDVVSGLKSNVFSFEVREMQEVKVCICSILLHPLNIDIKLSEEIPFNILISFPFNGKSVVITGCLKNSPILNHNFNLKIKSLSDLNLKKELTNLMINQVEDWCVSKELFNKVAKHEELITESKLNVEYFYRNNDVNFFD